jgi:hypothetical protein
MEIYEAKDGYRARIKKDDDIVFVTPDAYESEDELKSYLGVFDKNPLALAYAIREYMKKHHSSEFVGGAVRVLIEDLILAIASRS